MKLKPRNTVVRATLARMGAGAGVHRKSKKADRRAGKLAVRSEVGAY